MGNGMCGAEGPEEGLHPLLGLLQADQLHSSAGGTSKAQVIPQRSHWGRGFRGTGALGVWNLVGLRPHV